jgi:PilZ domain-containing protein
MERRKQPRVNIDQEVTVTILGTPDSSPFAAAAVEISGSGMRILSPVPVPYQAAVKVQAGDLLLLGEVIRVESGKQGHMLAVKLQHSLEMWGDLYRLNDAIGAEDRKTGRMSAEKRA